MRARTITPRALFGLLALALVAAGCGGDGDDAASREGPTITVGSFNFPESVVLAEIYAQALEADGYPVARELNLGARELIFSDLERGSISLLPEYLGSALAVGFGGEASADREATLQALQAEFDAIGVTVLEPAPAENKNVFAVTQAFADEHGVSKVSDLASLSGLTLGGPPECEDRQTCYAGLRDVYGLDLAFESIQEQPIRVGALQSGEIDVALLFSTDAVIAQENLVALEDDQGLIPVENIVPVVSDDILDAYGDDLVSLLNRISAEITTEGLIELNTKIADGGDPAQLATEWLEEHGLL